MDCFGDGNCFRTDSGGAPQAGWAGLEYYEQLQPKRWLVGRAASGTVPAHVQDAEGAEVYALLFWLRRLDPTSRLKPVYHTDAQRIVDDCNGLWKVDDPWVPHREW